MSSPPCPVAEKPKARLLTKAGFQEASLMKTAWEVKAKTGSVLGAFVGWLVFGVDGDVLGVATETWVDQETGDLWCHYKKLLPTS